MIPVKTGFHLFVIKGHMTSQALYILNEEDEKKKVILTPPNYHLSF